MAISHEEVQHVARLARLDLTDEETERFRGQLNVILERAQRIQKLDMDGVEPTAHPIDLRNVLRPDEVRPADVAAEILRAAPQAEDAFFHAPKILEEEE